MFKKFKNQSKFNECVVVFNSYVFGDCLKVKFITEGSYAYPDIQRVKTSKNDVPGTIKRVPEVETNIGKRSLQVAENWHAATQRATVMQQDFFFHCDAGLSETIL